MTAHPQTALAAAMIRAGVKVTQTRLYQLAVDTLRKYRVASDRGFSVFEHIVEDDPDLIREALLFFYTRLDADMSGAGHVACADGQLTHAGARQPNGEGGHPLREDQSPAATSSVHGGASHHVGVTQVPDARSVREPSAEERAAAGRVAQAIAITVFDRVKTSDGRPWGNVGAHELDGMERDGAVARIVKAKLGILSNAQRFQTLRELMRPDLFEEAIAQARGEIHAVR